MISNSNGNKNLLECKRQTTLWNIVKKWNSPDFMIKKPFGTCGSMIVGLQQTKKKYIIGWHRIYWSF